MIGVIPKQGEVAAVEEFFQLFKTPWELFRPGVAYDVVLVSGEEPVEAEAKLVLVFGSAARPGDRKNKPSPGASRQNARIAWNGVECPLYGELLTFGAGRGAILATTTSEAAAVEVESENPRVIRLGYDLFEEVSFLLTTGQPLENANIPTLDLHVAVLQDLILKSGVPLVEIPPAPAGCDFAVRVPQRDQVLAMMNARGLNCAIHYPVPIHLQEAYRPLGLPPGSFPVVERVAGELLSLPMFPELRPGQVERVAEGLKDCLAEVDLALR